jgi:hypothetical protein
VDAAAGLAAGGVHSLAFEALAAPITLDRVSAALSDYTSNKVTL